MAGKASIRPLTALIADIAAPGIEIERAMTKVRAELSAGNQAAANAVGAQQPYRRSPLVAGERACAFDGVLAPSKAART
jgi:hypothetical protein